MCGEKVNFNANRKAQQDEIEEKTRKRKVEKKV